MRRISQKECTFSFAVFPENTEKPTITGRSQTKQAEAMNMKEKNIFSAVRNGQYGQYQESIKNVDVNCRNEYGQNLLQEAISSNRDGIAVDLVDKGIDVNHQDYWGLTPLHFCAQYHNVHIAELLLKNKADVNAANTYGNNPLWTAVFYADCDYRVVELFVKNGADAQHKNKANRSPLDFAQQIEDADMIKILLDRE